MAIQFLADINLDPVGKIYVDSITNNFGIGTTSPSRKLQVIGTDGVAKFYYNSSFTNAQYSVIDVGMMTSGTAADGFGGKITFRMGSNGFDGFEAANIGTKRSGADNTHSLTFSTSNAGSITEKMVITNSGNVGIGTTNPSRVLQVIGTDGVAKLYYNSSFTNSQYSVVDIGMMTSGTAANGFGPKITFRMGGNGFDGFTAGSIGTIRNGADNTHDLNFATSSGGTLTTKMTITNAGDVGIGTASPDGFLHIDGMTSSKAAIVAEAAGSGDNVIMEMQNNSAEKRMTLQYDNSNINFNITDRNDDPIITFRESGNIGIGLEDPSSLLEMSGSLDNTSSKLLRLTRSNQGSAPAKAVGFYSNSGERGSITVSNFATAYNTSSDYRLKENVVQIENAINRLMFLKPCRFNFISEEQVVDGFLAHEAQSIVPEAISGEKDQIDKNGNEVYQGIDQAKLVPLLTAALQEAIERIEILEQKK